MDVLRSMGILIGQPWLALIPAAVFLACAAAGQRRTILLVVAAMWLMYCGYELAMKYRILCSGECNIRIDLLVLYPLLLAASVIGLAVVVRNGLKRTTGDPH